MKVTRRFASWWGVWSCRSRDRVAALALVALLLLAGACSPVGRAAVRPGRNAWVGIASWYGPKYDGRRTASGEVYDMYGLTAAHRSLPFGTRLRVTNLRNHRSVVVEITDRGPFVAGREIDLSLGAARQINMVDEGLAKVKIERLN